MLQQAIIFASSKQITTQLIEQRNKHKGDKTFRINYHQSKFVCQTNCS